MSVKTSGIDPVVIIECFFFLFLVFLVCFCFLGPHVWHMKVPRLGVELEL